MISDDTTIIFIKSNQFLPHVHRYGRWSALGSLGLMLKRSTVTSLLSDVLTKGAPGGKGLHAVDTLWQSCNGMLLIINLLDWTDHVMGPGEMPMKVSNRAKGRTTYVQA